MGNSNSVVRDRNPELRLILEMAQERGSKYAEFVPNPTCCSICDKRRGKVFRISTLLKREYLTVHPNCVCSWRPISAAQPLVSTKSEDMEDTMQKARPGLVKKVITNKAGKKQTVYVREGVKETEPKKHSEEGEGSSDFSVDGLRSKLSAKVKMALNKAADALRSLKPGKSGKHNGVPIKNVGNGSFSVHGLVFGGLHQASLAVHAVELVAGTGVGFATGGRSGEEVTRKNESAQIVDKLEHGASKVKSIASKVSDKLDKKLAPKKRERTRKSERSEDGTKKGHRYYLLKKGG